MGKDNNPSTLKEVVDKLRETHLLMAALVATVAFTAAIAVPGVYKADDKGTVVEGTAILSHNSAFKTFVMTNAMAFVSSLLAIFLHFLSVFIFLGSKMHSSDGWLNCFHNGSHGCFFQGRL
ncbi:hypothetical protein PVK06_034787 [Gossypium arboreum]|uniref:PGG domain-containing protein n=1 Tax=Gossypium arboreum TaxID=29729 RepID=A0ABR0NF69_GOSAR|nr:hypothetical protein PVK06_034787 [Gossypium arboreum]